MLGKYISGVPPFSTFMPAVSALLFESFFGFAQSWTILPGFQSRGLVERREAVPV
jgi:hypothetical protein